MRRECLAILLIALLFFMAVGIVLTLQHLYQIPEKIISETGAKKNITPSSGQLERFHSYDELTGYIKSVGPESWVQPIRFSLTTTMATTTSVELNVKGEEKPEYYSNTNVQVAGIDEADIVKTDGEYIYLVSSDAVKIVRVYPLKKAGLFFARFGVHGLTTLYEIGLVSALHNPDTLQQACHPLVIRMLEVRSQTVAVLPQFIHLHARRNSRIRREAIIMTTLLFLAGQTLYVSGQFYRPVTISLRRKLQCRHDNNHRILTFG
jgi:hypothetical protein